MFVYVRCIDTLGVWKCWVNDVLGMLKRAKCNYSSGAFVFKANSFIGLIDVMGIRVCLCVLDALAHITGIYTRQPALLHFLSHDSIALFDRLYSYFL